MNEKKAVTDKIDQSLSMLWAVLGAGVVLKPSGYLGWNDMALWIAGSWMVAMLGIWYLRATTARA
jgi:hypothetical protein